jgi:CHAT domain-containing protein
LRSCLLLAEGERLELGEILARPALHGTRLVVLSACETAVSDVQHAPDQAIGLAGGFLRAGCAGVVASLWRVDDLTSAALMVRFYQNYMGAVGSTGRALRPAQALRAAELWLREATADELVKFGRGLREHASDEIRNTANVTRALRSLGNQIVLRFVAERPKSKPYNGSSVWAAFVAWGA